MDGQKDDAGVKHQDQYFSAQPQSADLRRSLHVTLRSHELDVIVSNGVFSSSRLDLGTSVLLRHAPTPPEHGRFLDLGCGWGPIALTLALESPEAEVHAVDINERALELTTENARINACTNIQSHRPDDLPSDMRFDLIWSNPPIRVGKEALHSLLTDYLNRLNPGGRAYLVVQKNLGADSLIAWLSRTLNEGQAIDASAPAGSATPSTEWSIGKIASSKGFRVIEVIRPEDPSSAHGRADHAVDPDATPDAPLHTTSNNSANPSL